MGLLKFLFYRKKKEEKEDDLPLIAKVKFKTEEEVNKSLEDYINNNDVCILGRCKYRPLSGEDSETKEDDAKKDKDLSEREL